METKESSKILKLKDLIEKNSLSLHEKKKEFRKGQRGTTIEWKETARAGLIQLTKKTRHMYIAYAQLREVPRSALESKTPRAGNVDEKLLTEILKLISR